MDKVVRRVAQLESVLPCLDDVLGDLAAESDGVRSIVFGEAAEDGELGAEHVALGYRGDDLAGGQLDLVEGRRRCRCGPWRRGYRMPLPLPASHLFCAQDGRLHGEDLDDHVGDGAHDLLLVGELGHVLLRGGAGGEEGQLLGLSEQVELVGQRAFAVFLRSWGRP